MILIGCQQFFQYWLAVKIISQSDSDVIVFSCGVDYSHRFRTIY